MCDAVMPERIVDKHILKLFGDFKGRGFRFGNVFKYFLKRGTFHNQSDIWKNLEFLLKQKKIVKVRGMTRNFYGIPLVRENDTKYLIINQGIEDETIELGKVCKPKEP